MNYALMVDMSATDKFSELVKQSRTSIKSKQALTEDVTKLIHDGTGEKAKTWLEQMSKIYFEDLDVMLCKTSFTLSSTRAKISGTVNSPWIAIEQIPSKDTLEEIKQGEYNTVIIDLDTSNVMWDSRD